MLYPLSYGGLGKGAGQAIFLDGWVACERKEGSGAAVSSGG
jgi:hypothetical protein